VRHELTEEFEKQNPFNRPNRFPQRFGLFLKVLEGMLIYRFSF
jgi:hypothetical protein